jgi:hypothetical protein
MSSRGTRSCLSTTSAFQKLRLEILSYPRDRKYTYPSGRETIALLWIPHERCESNYFMLTVEVLMPFGSPNPEIFLKEQSRLRRRPWFVWVDDTEIKVSQQLHKDLIQFHQSDGLAHAFESTVTEYQLFIPLHVLQFFTRCYKPPLGPKNVGIRSKNRLTSCHSPSTRSTSC